MLRDIPLPDSKTEPAAPADAGTPIANRAEFSRIRYAQAWEDADLLLRAFLPARGGRVLSIGAAGDNVLGLLMIDPEEVVAADISNSQIECLRFRIAAIRWLEHPEFLLLTGSRPAEKADRLALFDRVFPHLDAASQAFWAGQRTQVSLYGLGGIGKFERYFRLFRNWMLPLVHREATVEAFMLPRGAAERKEFFERRFDTWRWRLMMRLFFSETVMGRLGRDKAFFEHVEGDLGAHLAARLRHAAIILNPAENPFLHWILTGHHGTALPLAWRRSHYHTIRNRLDRITIHPGPLETAPGSGFSAFNLSDIFEYMSEPEARQAFGRIARLGQAGARLATWNMLVPRSGAHLRPELIRALPELSRDLHRDDKAFFYSAFHVEEIR